MTTDDGVMDDPHTRLLSSGEPLNLSQVTRIAMRAMQHDFVPFQSVFTGKEDGTCQCGELRISPLHPNEVAELIHVRRRKLRVESPLTQDVTFVVLVEYEFDKDQYGGTHNVVGKVLTEQGWREFQPYETLGPDLPYISGLDMVTQARQQEAMEMMADKLSAILCSDSSASDIQDESHGSQDGNDGPHNVVSHDPPVPTQGPDQTPGTTPADNTNNQGKDTANG